MTSIRCSRGLKKLRYLTSFLGRRLVHTNLQILYQCNFKCRICEFWHPAYQGQPLLSLDQVGTIAEKLNQIGPQVISIGGGEPLLHPQIVGIVKTLARFHFPVMICNGWFVTEKLARSLFEAGMEEISVSVDYADAARHDRQRGVAGAHERALRALKILHAQRVRPDQRVHMISVIMDDNRQEIEPLLKRCKEMGITYLVTLYSSARGTKSTRSPAPDPSTLLLRLSRKYAEFVALRGYMSRFTAAVQGSFPQRCYAGKNLCNIDNKGDVSLCIDTIHQPVGNILNEPADRIRSKLQKAFQSNPCRSCWTSCRGSIETLMYGKGVLTNLRDYYRMVKPVALGPARAGRHHALW